MEPKKQSSGTDATSVKSNTDKNISPATTATISPTTTNEPANQTAVNIESGETNKSSSNSWFKSCIILILIIAALIGAVYLITGKGGPLNNALAGNSTAKKNTTEIPTLASSESSTFETEEPTQATRNRFEKTTTDLDREITNEPNRKTTTDLDNEITNDSNRKSTTASNGKTTIKLHRKTTTVSVLGEETTTSPIRKQTTENESKQTKIVNVENEINDKTTAKTDVERIEDDDDDEDEPKKIIRKNENVDKTSRLSRFRNTMNEYASNLKDKIKEKTGSKTD